MAQGRKLGVKVSTKMPGPRKRPSGASKFVRAEMPRQPGIKTNVYTKEALRSDPSNFFDFGFGDTGLTGES